LGPERVCGNISEKYTSFFFSCKSFVKC